MVFFSTSTYICFAIAIMLFLICRYFKSRTFAWIMNLETIKMGAKFTELKKDLFKPLHETVSQNPALRKEKVIRILEVGVGSGANFKFYPDGTKLVVVDPNPHFSTYYNKNRSEFPNIQSQAIIQTTGDKMDMLESDSMDAVVMTTVLCSVTDMPSLLKEVKRVMVPGGKFYFLDHVKDPNKDHYFTRALQEFLTITGIWPFFFDGCMTNKEIIPDLERAGFASVEKTRVELPFGCSLLNPGIVGVAIK